MVATKLYGGELSGFKDLASDMIDWGGECMVAIAAAQCTMFMPHHGIDRTPHIVRSSAPPEITRRDTDLLPSRRLVCMTVDVMSVRTEIV
jgi:hypothetical protein